MRAALLLAAAAAATASAAAPAPAAPPPMRRLDASGATCVAEWVAVNYSWPSPAAYAAAIANSTYVPENNVITGLKFWRDTMYVTVPRWRHGVPATLATVVMPPAGGGGGAQPADGCRASDPLLQPFPSWEFQALDNVAGLKYTQSMEIEPASGLMWMLDVGRLNIYDPDVPPTNTAPPKLVLYSIPDAAVVQTYLFTDDVAPYASSFLNDIVVDVTDGIGYISDASGPGAIIVYDRTRNAARRFSDATTEADPSTVIAVDGVLYPGIDTPSDGIALSPDRKTLFYCALRGSTLYAVPTAALRDFALTTAQISAQVAALATKPPSDGMTTSSLGALYFGDLNGDRVVAVANTGAPAAQATLAANATTMQWQDTFAWAGPGQLAFTTNRLQLFIVGSVDISGAAGASMRVFVASVPGDNYMAGMAPYATPTPAPSGGSGGGGGEHAAAVVMGVLFVAATLAAGGLGAALWRARAAGRGGGAGASADYAHM